MTLESCSSGLRKYSHDSFMYVKREKRLLRYCYYPLPNNSLHNYSSTKAFSFLVLFVFSQICFVNMTSAVGNSPYFLASNVRLTTILCTISEFIRYDVCNGIPVNDPIIRCMIFMSLFSFKDRFIVFFTVFHTSETCTVVDIRSAIMGKSAASMMFCFLSFFTLCRLYLYPCQVLDL